MIDPRLRNEHLVAAGADPTTAVVLLDVVLGYGAHAVGAIEAARDSARGDGREICIVASVCGTPGDPQGLAAQETRLAGSGVIVARSNALAARIAARIADAAAVPAGGGG